uniref:U4/U6.U5 tri-snRNP-associated protein 1-like n=1 Tax=Phallusia mammillata TaxID=59560 RepID=A0A6F9DS76_9ASCI|nr:U4/U6.U5 tri-snRNP-associated protein 1-like [Phallusia mammillata]
MGSKKDHKHKKEHKHKHRRKHKRSDSADRQSRSPTEKRKYESDEEVDQYKSSKRQRGQDKHKKEKRRRDYEDSPKERSTRNQEVVEEVIEEEEVYVAPAEEQSVSEPTSHQTENQSLSIDETNRIRAKLGLKPLEVKSSGANGEGAGKSEEDFVHAPAADLWKQKKEKEMRDKIQASRDKRKMNQKLSKIKTLGEEDEEESAASWVMKSRHQEAKIKKEKKMAAIDDEFGVGSLVSKEMGKSVKKEPSYSERDLKGMNVEHSLDSFVDGKSAVLVIKDKEILASDDEDVLHSVNVDDVEKAKKNLDIKRRGTGYKAYEEEEVDELGFFKAKTTLGKYDEEIEGERKNRFKIGNQGLVDTSWEQQKILMKQEIRAKGETLELPALKLATEYLTEEEMKFKKRKRKVKKVRKREVLKAEDLLPLPGETTGKDHGSRSTPGKIPGWDEGVEITKTAYNQAVEIEDDNVIQDDEDVVNELQRALEKTRKAKLKQAEGASDGGAMKVAQHLETLSQANLEKPDEQYSNTLFLNSTDEFCRQLGNPIKSTSITQEEDMDIESDGDEEEPMQMSAWSSVDPGKKEKVEDTKTNEIEGLMSQHTPSDHAPIEAEPLAANGLLGALKLAERKGYLSEETSKKGNLIVTTNKNSSLYSKNYAIEDKNAVDYLDKYANEKYMKDRSRFDRGMVSEFTEKADYKPKIAIEYVDDHGKNLSAKEAFRTLSHRFHGKGSGKSKQEKRMKKSREEETMKHMSSTDTPLNTVAMMKEKLRSESSPYIVLSGAGKTLMAGGSLSKTK